MEGNRTRTLDGLDDIYDCARSETLCTKPFPKVGTFFVWLKVKNNGGPQY